MARKQTRTGSKGADTKASARKEEIEVDVKVGILHTIAKAIYSTPAGKIREAVANARDNGASWIVIIVDQTRRSLSVFDNGTGISKERFHHIFKSIGYGLLKHDKEKKLSYFGLGLMSIFQLGKRIRLFTRAEGTNELLHLNVDAESIFSSNNEEKSIASLMEYLVLTTSSERERRAASPPVLNEQIAGPRFKDRWESFTEIVIEDIPEDDFTAICGDAFTDELRKILPLKADENEPFLKQLTGKKAKQVREILANPDYCKTADVYFGVQEEGGGIEPLWKYFPSFRSDLSFPDDNVLVAKSPKGEFAYYILYSVAVDLHRVAPEERETGFWIRNQNFLVKGGDFLERPGPGRKLKTIDQPLKPWIFGEIFHKDMNAFLTVSRNDFLFDNKDFKEFRDQIATVVNPLNQELRDIYEKQKRILEGFIQPFSKFAAADGPMQKIEGRLKEMIGEENIEAFNTRILKALEQAREPRIENEELRIDKILARGRETIKIGEDEGAVVLLDPKLNARSEEYRMSWDSKERRIIASVSPSLFSPKKVVFLKQTFDIVFVAQKDADLGVSVDTKKRVIYVNPFNEHLTKYSVSIFDVYVALQVAKVISSTKEEVVRNALALLGVPSPVASRYVTPLGDELRRNARLRK